MLVRHNPWDFLNELSSLVEQQKRGDDSQVESSRWLPAVDIKEEANHFTLFVDVPGVDPKDIEISMENNVLTIKGSRDETKKEERKTYHRTERIKGMFYRRFTLPETADADHINAKNKQGVLEITIAKKKIAQARKIEIKSEE